MAGNRRIQSKDIAGFGNLNDDGFAFGGGSGQFCVAGTEDEHSTWLLALEE